MTKHIHKLWFSLLNKRPYVSSEPNFHDTKDVSGILNLEQNHHVILEELNAYLSQFVFNSHFNETMVEQPESWKVRSLRVWGVEMYEIQKHFPKTLALLNQIDDVVNIGFNLLEPNGRIKPHCGDTNAVIRCHLGLVIPDKLFSCGIKVGNETRHWEKAKTLAFTDAFDHEAWNNTNQQRIILLFDVLKPEYKTNKYKICGVVLASLYMQKLGNLFPKMYHINPIWMWPVTYPLSFLMTVLLPVRNYLKK